MKVQKKSKLKLIDECKRVLTMNKVEFKEKNHGVHFKISLKDEIVDYYPTKCTLYSKKFGTIRNIFPIDILKLGVVERKNQMDYNYGTKTHIPNQKMVRCSEIGNMLSHMGIRYRKDGNQIPIWKFNVGQHFVTLWPNTGSIIFKDYIDDISIKIDKLTNSQLYDVIKAAQEGKFNDNHLVVSRGASVNNKFDKKLQEIWHKESRSTFFHITRKTFDTVKIYTDGSKCDIFDTEPGGWAAVLYFQDGVRAGEVVRIKGSSFGNSQKMEVMAVTQALLTLEEKYNVELYTDSMYVTNSITKWIKTWKKNGWKTKNKTPVKFKELWKEIDRLCKENFVTVHWIKGHSGIEGNEEADKLANEARRMATKKIDKEKKFS